MSTSRRSLSLLIAHTSLLLLLTILYLSCINPETSQAQTVVDETDLRADTLPEWMVGPFVKADSVNPCLLPSPSSGFLCPVLNHLVRWEAKDVFNPAVIAHDGRLQMLYRAEDSIGRFAGTSRLGLASSADGLQFEKLPVPVFYPDRDQMFQYEWEGGCEDPRIVRRADGRYVMTYTAYDGETARLCIASSADLKQWTKHGLAFARQPEDKYAGLWSKSGAIVSVYGSDGTITAKQVNGLYWMYWGDKDLHLATSKDLISWTPLLDSTGALLRVLSPRQGMFDSDLVEPGPPAMLRDTRILLIYNSRNYGENRDTTIAEGTYSAGQVLFDVRDPQRVLHRSDVSFFVPDREYEISGQVNRVVFVEGLVRWNDKWFLYYGTADSKIAVAHTQ